MKSKFLFPMRNVIKTPKHVYLFSFTSSAMIIKMKHSIKTVRRIDLNYLTDFKFIYYSPMGRDTSQAITS